MGEVKGLFLRILASLTSSAPKNKTMNYKYTGRTTTLDNLKGLLKASIKLVKFVSVMLVIGFLIAFVIDKFTGSYYDTHYCHRIVNQQLKKQLHC